MKTAIVWFKTDLRVHDNETLAMAVAENDQVVPCYCVDDRHFRYTSFGFKKTGNHRARFLMESLEDLNRQLQSFGSSLLVVFGKPEQLLPQLAKQYKAAKVYTKKEVAHEELEVCAAVEKALWKEHCTMEFFSTSTLYLATDLPFSIKNIPDVFTTFRKKAEKETPVRDPFPAPVQIHSPELPAFSLPSWEDLDLEAPVPDSRTAFPFSGGETEALKRMQYYFYESKCIAAYKETRNGLIGTDYSSKFSPWLALGCISPRTIYYELKRYESIHGSNASTYWLYVELLWRDYFRFMMKKHHTAYFMKFGIKGSGADVAALDPQTLKKWTGGHTGVDFVDANMIELSQTGFMSNRGRQNVASYLCNDLKIDWRYGAAYFEEQLIDYDVCSNWGNWAYLAGVGNDAREDRYFNIEKQAAAYDPDGAYRTLWLGM